MAVLGRYEGQPVYVDSNGNLVSARYKRLDKNLPFNTMVTEAPTTLDILAMQYYGSPLLFWVIGDFNDMLDPTIEIGIGTTLKLPRIT